MYEAAAKERWIMHGRLTIDTINSQRGINEQISPVGRYPYFDPPEQHKAAKEDELRLVKMLQATGWATVTIL